MTRKNHHLTDGQIIKNWEMTGERHFNYSDTDQQRDFIITIHNELKHLRQLIHQGNITQGNTITELRELLFGIETHLDEPYWKDGIIDGELINWGPTLDDLPDHPNK